MTFRTLAALGLGISLPALLVVPGSGATASVAAPADRSTAAAKGQERPAHVPRKFLEQKPVWRPCGDPEYRTSCTKITAPRDWWNPADRHQVEIAVSRVAPARGKPSRVVFGNPGGPGGAGLGMAPFLASRPALAKNHLAIGFDPRGTGDSTNVTCGGAPGYSMDARDRDRENLDLIEEASRLVRPYCDRQSRGLLPFVTTAQTVQDMELIRRLLGYDKIDYVGYSGGTWLGAYYQTYYPEHVGRFVLDSNTDFTRSWVDTFEAQPEAFERRFREDFAPWAAKYDHELKLGRTPRLVIRTYERLRRDLKERPAVESFLDGSIRITYDQNALDNIVIGDLYSKQDFTALAVDLAFLRDLAAAQRDGGARAAQRKVDALPRARQQQLVHRATRRTVGLPPFGAARPFADDAEDATFVAVTCNDSAWPQGPEYGEQLAARLGPRYPLLGWGMTQNPCFYWDRPRFSTPTPTGRGVPTTLMVQSVNDPATNVSLARSAHQRYAGSRLITVTDEGDHGVYGGVNKCADRLVDTFLTTGKAPAADVTCKGEGIPAPSLPNPDDVGYTETATAGKSPLRRIAGLTEEVSGYLS